ncbi:hypothetical protein ABZ322_06670 [Streptomyces sp. NPDC006129]|uniref:hypothetical protein n=1 Tax=Streptomyces sp. NPDC006129 TaxID=3155348 RepID=UPI0033AFE40E
MITTLPVGSWSWETMTHRPDDNPVARCVRQTLDSWTVLRSLGLADGDAQADITALGTSEGTTLTALKRVHVSAARIAQGSELSEELQSLDPSQVKVVTIDMTTPGTYLRDGKACHAQKVFALSVDAWTGGAGTVTLDTFSDVWLSHDARGHKQTEVRRENAPRLASALAGISRITRSQIVPADPRTYGVPTVDGFEDFPDDDADLLDFWYMLEVPRRTRWLLNQLPSGSEHFEACTESPVTFVEVVAGSRVIGYLWAADNDDAAGYEPRTPSGDIAVEAGTAWLTRLSDAKQRGLSPAEALRELSARQGDSRAGTVVAGSLRRAASLEDLQDLSGRE